MCLFVIIVFVICNTPRLIYDAYVTAKNFYRDFYETPGRASASDVDAASWNNASAVAATTIAATTADAMMSANVTGSGAAMDSAAPEEDESGGPDYWNNVFMVR